MTTKQTDTVVMTEQQLDTVVGGAYELKNVQVVSVVREMRRRPSGDISRVAAPDWARPYRIGIPPEPE